MIGFLVQARVRIKIMIRVRNRVRVGVMFNVDIYHLGALVAGANVVPSTLPKLTLHLSNNHMQVPFSLFSIVLNPHKLNF